MTTRRRDLRDQSEEAHGPGPGHRLHEARQMAGMSVRDVSQRLRLDQRTIQHLEADEFEHLPAPAFVRGYLRGYARLLNLSPQPIVAAFDERGFQPPAILPDIADQSQARSDDFPMRIATYGIVIAMALMVSVWWQSRETPSPLVTSVSETGKVTEEPGVVTELPVAQATPVEQVPEAETPTITPPPLAEAAPTPDPAPAMVAEAPPPKSDVPAPVADGSAALPMAPAEIDELAPPTSIDDDTLQLTFANDSWTEIYDADEQRLYFGLASAGQTLALDGRAPFRLVLGFARGVRIEYNGAPFDPAPYIDREIARFTLGEERVAPIISPAIQ